MSNMPMRYVVMYLFFTLAAYLVSYGADLSVRVVFYVTACFVVLAFGAHGRLALRLRDPVSSVTTRRIQALVTASVVAVVLISLVNIATFYSDWSSVTKYLLDPSAAYEYVKLRRRNEDFNSVGLSSFAGVLLTSLSFSRYMLVGFAIMFWNRLSRQIRLLVLFALVVYLGQCFLIGAMVNIGSLLASAFPFFLYRVRSRAGVPSGGSRLFMLIVLGAGLATMMYFVGSRGEFGGNADFGETIRSGAKGLLFYVSHGYEGLAHCLDLPFEPTGGRTLFYGFSTTLSTDSSWFAHSYLGRSEEAFGWSALQVWSTAFPWIASDLTFWSVPVLMLFVGVLSKKLWSEGVRFDNPFALLALGQIMIFAAYIPANNQLFHTFGNSVGVLAIFIMYTVSVRKGRTIVLREGSRR
ncbi:hypothetical protein [Propionimicrobium sp. PCR01-08-3]|uniref:hypothetical protein n=1 Tax=Propionimicrobium sp. PCR01-08-3 TaxID=3052086 RepID=UPI00255CC817|nr:hypothetical protein [Propionimicrobium sp. PCR01-08-3]WIY82996.1 hypothetical protein QQ658_01120 [Propionimicrobium sp. PCR01-08-3]